MDKMTDKIPQDGAKMRTMTDVSSVGAPWRSYEGVRTANSAASPGPGEGYGRVNLWRFKDLKPILHTPEAQGLGGLYRKPHAL